MSQTYNYLSSYGSVALTACSLWAAGVTGWALLLLTLLLMFPVAFVVRVQLFALLPPKLEPVWHSSELYDREYDEGIGNRSPAEDVADKDPAIQFQEDDAPVPNTQRRLE